MNEEVQERPPDGEFKIYRQPELRRITASLLANGAILVVGEQGSGKSVLRSAVIKKLSDDGFLVASVEPTTLKQMMTEICFCLDIPTETLQGKSLTIEKLKIAIAKRSVGIADFFKENTAFLILDDAQSCDRKFRFWLKKLRRQGVPMLVLATNPPRSDIFIRIPRIELRPLPERAIREIMESAAIERAIALLPTDLSKLQQRAGGNPMLAIRAIEEEYLGLNFEGADHRRYFDITPLISVIGVLFIIMRFIGLGTNNEGLYIFGGISAAIFLGVYRLLDSLPREERRIR
ncbi:MAG: ATP-binding protein [Dolichospermum sp. DET50]|nr:ATP-binding protein [Dolichospermum sp. DET66]MBS3033871.1 ATP-binding protein [Dolichospermum sp. DET67]MBS3039074.1 ATP-binding protein [Dolichospermum sp. DET50]QSX66320.1 MAG: ATP-binding protein [Dolichospermum sp. DET69]